MDVLISLLAFKITDRLGSPLGVMDKDGQFRQRSESGYINNVDTRLTFSPFGAGRNRDFQPRTQSGEMPGRINLTPATRQGFTGHEHLDSLGLIHMNGRVYDHRLGRFLSVDPFIQFPANSQSLNPYSYIMNNPMAGVDPSGYVARRIRPDQEIGPCSGIEHCYVAQAASGPVNDFRGSVQSGGAPEGTWNGWQKKQAVRKADKNVLPTVEIGELKSLVDNMKDGVMLAQEGTMTDKDIREILGEEDPRAGARRGAKTAGEVMDAIGDAIEPGFEDAVGVIGKVKDAKKVGEAVGRSLDELSDLRKASEPAKDALPDTFSFGRIGAKDWSPPRVVTNRHGYLTNGVYTLDDVALAVHMSGNLSAGKSQFFHRVNSRQLTLDAAAYADHAGLWVGNKAKVVLDRPIGVHGGTGVPTSVINVYRNRNGFVYASPGGAP